MSFTACSTAKRERNITVQAFRAIAIIAVVMIHTTPNGEWQVFCRPFINYAVASFLFLSGYLTKADNGNWTSFCKKRITRVLVPYVVWTVLYSLPMLYHSGPGGISRLVYNLITTGACGTFYYIYVYIQFVLLTPLMFRLANSKFRHIGWIIAPASIMIFKYAFLFTGASLNRYMALAWSLSCLGWFTFYYLGLLLGNGIIERQFRLKSLLILYALSIPLQMAEGYLFLMFGDANCGTQLKLTSLLTSTIFLLIIHMVLKTGKNLGHGFIKTLDDYSFGIYLSHIMVLHVLHTIPFFSALSYPVNSAVVLLATFCCCYVGSKICGKKSSGWLGLR